MSFSNRLSDIHPIDRIYLQEKAVDSPYSKRLIDALPSATVATIRDKADIPAAHLTMKTIYLHSAPKPTFGPCPGSKGHLCCNYRTVDIYEGCPIGCSYCIMRSYLTFAPVSINVEVDQEILAIKHQAAERAGRALRVGTGEVGDSLLFDHLTGISGDLIRGLSGMDNVYLELKTKSANIDHLLSISDKGNGVIGFSVNPDELAPEQGWAAPMAERIAAARRAADAGYLLAFHFDPVIAIEGWETAYDTLIDALAALKDARIAWISLGTIRFTPSLRERMPDRGYLFDEFVPGRDGKFRYLQRRRRKIYRRLYVRLKELFDAPIYLCMESRAVWESVFGTQPEQIPPLRDIFDPCEEES